MKRTNLLDMNEGFMKKTLVKTTAAMMIFALAFLGFGFVLTNDAQAQTRRNTRRTTRVNDRQVEKLSAASNAAATYFGAVSMPRSTAADSTEVIRKTA